MTLGWPAASGWQSTNGDTIKHLVAWQWQAGQLICVSCMPIGTGLELSDRFPEWADVIGEVYPWTIPDGTAEDDLICDLCGQPIIAQIA
ncbi:hypothetical protein BZB76_5142 [Actinomadura pelletieri DSM 43383]|uniref:Uncharacterized protein n=1 Tax=Actinomadura pelletieri DSM 43383 TaxID=1120940 RepID=A0A495QFG0_9ACTN|nr:hypothetical protein [Actinomadura pelletieri]RKS70667.1 hypothetical protein BZB76_5142 [Actinomadura pelletieri DSM 43383]